MDKPDENIINEIAQQLDCGNDCYYNSKTKELISIPNADLLASGDTEYHMQFFKEDIDRINRQKKDLIKFEVLQSFQSFKIMENFAYQVTETNLREKLSHVLFKGKPFRNFKYLIDNSEYREEWFAFKQKEMEKIVKETMEFYTASK